MGFPTEKVTKSSHVDINLVSSMLRRRHAGKFMVWNLRFVFLNDDIVILIFACDYSEKKYDYSKFNDSVRV